MRLEGGGGGVVREGGEDKCSRRALCLSEQGSQTQVHKVYLYHPQSLLHCVCRPGVGDNTLAVLQPALISSVLTISRTVFSDWPAPCTALLRQTNTAALNKAIYRAREAYTAVC